MITNRFKKNSKIGYHVSTLFEADKEIKSYVFAHIMTIRTFIKTSKYIPERTQHKSSEIETKFADDCSCTITKYYEK